MPDDLRSEQAGVLRGMVLAVAVSAVVLVGFYLFWPFPVPVLPTLAERLAYVLRADLFVFLWLVAAVANVANRRFFSAADIQGGGLSEPSPAIAIPGAVLQNTLEQTVLAVGSHLVLAVLLPPRGLVLIPLLVVLFCLGRALFWWRYKDGAAGRAAGFGLTFYPTVAAYGIALIALLAML
jgi:hypothetical protein